MQAMYITLMTLHVIVCALVVFIVLIQSGKGAGLSNVFGGGGGGDALFSAPSGSMFIRKLTTGLAVAFFLTSLLLTYMSARRTRSLWSGMNLPAGAQAPMTMPIPAAQAPAASAGETTPAAEAPPAAPSTEKAP